MPIAHENDVALYDSDIPLPRLLPGEKLVAVEDFPDHSPDHPPSAIDQLMRLARAKTIEDIGEFGPPMASIALEREEGAHISAELKKYEVTFGRDSLRVSIDLLPMYPKLLRATIISLAELQGVTFHDGREEQPGRIIHEERTPDDPVAQRLTAERGWEWPYYASVDATLMFIHAIRLYTDQAANGKSLLETTYVGRDNQTRTIKDAMENSLRWIDFKRAENPHGFVEFRSPLPKGIENQVWRDSWDSYSHADGKLANRFQPIASIEVQQLAYDACLDAADIYEEYYGDGERASELRTEAEEIRAKTIEHFWVNEKGGYFALGIDRDDEGNMRQLKIRTSSMGHLLNSRILEGDDMRPYVEALVYQLFTPEMLNVSGIRTLATDEVRFRPGAYQNGSVWAWETMFIADGLRRHGFFRLAQNLATRVHNVIQVTQRFPEYVRGDDHPSPRINPRVVDLYDDDRDRINRVEQPPQEVQAWTVAAALKLEYYSGREPEFVPEPWVLEYEESIIENFNLEV
jgi:glycogen debranching enzyme